MNAGVLRERVHIERPQLTPDGKGGRERVFVPVATRAAGFKYDRGREGQVIAGQGGTALFRVQLRSERITREISNADRLVNARNGEIYNVREVDEITDRDWVWLRVERGVAT